MTWFMVRCINCDAAGGRILAQPFRTREDRARWQNLHEEGTGHVTSTWEEFR